MDEQIKQNIDFILSHFEIQHELFPRTIMTSQTKGQKVIEYETDERQSRDRIFEVFKKSRFIDCRINALSHNIEHSIDFEVKNKIAANFIMIDLDLKDFDNDKKKLNTCLDKTTKKISTNFHDKITPTILWTGNGYHIYQPLEGMVFEKHIEFYKFLPYVDGRDLTTEFLRFSEKFFTSGHSDFQHTPSIKSCFTRVPGTINSKNDQVVELIQKWDGKFPNIRWITKEFQIYLIQKRIDKIKETEKRLKNQSKKYVPKLKGRNQIEWIENLLKTPLNDYRYYCLWKIFIPYLVNVRGIVEFDIVMKILSPWLNECDKLRKLSFEPVGRIKGIMKGVKNYSPISLGKVKEENKELYQMLKFTT